jgi:hypothetical protein
MVLFLSAYPVEDISKQTLAGKIFISIYIHLRLRPGATIVSGNAILLSMTK